MLNKIFLIAYASSHSGGFGSEIIHSIGRGIGWGIGRKFASALPLKIIILIVVIIAIYLIYKWWKNRHQQD